MNGKMLSLIAAAGIAAFGATASYGAQDPVDAPTDAPMTAAQADRTMQQFAMCIVADPARGATIDQFFRTQPESPEFGALAAQLSVQSCVPAGLGVTGMNYKSSLLRSVLFDARYRTMFAGKPAPNISGAGPVDFMAEFNLPDEKVATDLRYSRLIGDCVARGAPADAHALLLAETRSPAEDAALARLMPTLQSCVPADSTLKFSRPVLRGMLGEAMYKLAGATGRSLPASNAN